MAKTAIKNDFTWDRSVLLVRNNKGVLGKIKFLEGSNDNKRFILYGVYPKLMLRIALQIYFYRCRRFFTQMPSEPPGGIQQMQPLIQRK